MTTNPVPIATLDDDAASLLELQEKIEELSFQAATIQARLAQRGPGTYPTSHGVKVVVTAPSRSFNLDKALTMLTPDQLALCQGPVAAKVKKQLAGVLVDECMEPGTGSPTVKVV